MAKQQHPVLVALMAMSAVDPFPGADEILDLAQRINSYSKDQKNFIYFILLEYEKYHGERRKEHTPPGCSSLGSGGGVRINLSELSTGALHCLSLLDRMDVRLTADIDTQMK